MVLHLRAELAMRDEAPARRGPGESGGDVTAEPGYTFNEEAARFSVTAIPIETPRNPEQDVLDAIDELVDEQLSGGPTDDYCKPYAERCPQCGGPWHGLRRDDCPGATGIEGDPGGGQTRPLVAAPAGDFHDFLEPRPAPVEVTAGPVRRIGPMTMPTGQGVIAAIQAVGGEIEEAPGSQRDVIVDWVRSDGCPSRLPTRVVVPRLSEPIWSAAARLISPVIETTELETHAGQDGPGVTRYQLCVRLPRCDWWSAAVSLPSVVPTYVAGRGWRVRIPLVRRDIEATLVIDPDGTVVAEFRPDSSDRWVRMGFPE